MILSFKLYSRRERIVRQLLLSYDTTIIQHSCRSNREMTIELF